jgi:CRP-like cAMP-binding protein
MLDHYFNKLSKSITITEADKTILKQHVIVKKIRKRQYLLQEGDVCKQVAFVSKGMLRSYTTDDKGNERIIQFAPEGWFISDLYSMITGEPSTQNIDAIEDSELVLINTASQEKLQELIPEYIKFNYLQMRGAYIALQKRLADMFALSAEEKYVKLLNTYPDIVQRVPQHMIASYMGLTPETLSRIRKNISEKRS